MIVRGCDRVDRAINRRMQGQRQQGDLSHHVATGGSATPQHEASAAFKDAADQETKRQSHSSSRAMLQSLRHKVQRANRDQHHTRQQNHGTMRPAREVRRQERDDNRRDRYPHCKCDNHGCFGPIGDKARLRVQHNPMPVILSQQRYQGGDQML